MMIPFERESGGFRSSPRKAAVSSFCAATYPESVHRLLSKYLVRQGRMSTGLKDSLKRLSLGFALLLLCSGALLFSDLNSRIDATSDGKGSSRNKVGKPRIALVQHASIEAVDDGREGLLEELKKRGFVDGVNIELKMFNAEADMATANAIAKEVTSGEFDMILTLTTLSLQTVANANKSGRKTTHVFGLVTDPFGAGVGVDAENHLKHPPYMVGYGCMQPVEQLLKTMLQMRPEMKRLGLVWNPAESNSAAQTMLAREFCKKLSIELIEGNAENSSVVREVANSVIARGADAMWISGDVTVSLGATSVLSAAERSRIPVFSSLPPLVTKGALLDLGSDYLQIGRDLGDLAADVLEGKDPATIPVENKVKIIMLYNETVLPKLKDEWAITPEIRKNSVGFISDSKTDLPESLQDF